jgi:hypothetical protein
MSYHTAIILIQWKTFIYDMWPFIIYPALFNRKSYFSCIGCPETIHILFCIIQLLLRDKTHANVKKNKTMLKMVTILNEDENYE